jgi:GAF domain-containing protein
MSQAESGREPQLIEAFVGLADTLVDDYDMLDLLDQLVGHSVTLLAADAAGIQLADGQHNLRVVAASSEDADLMELLQLQADEGPCIECIRTGGPVSVADIADEAARWPRLVASLQDRGLYRSVHALPLRLRGEPIGALNLFHRRPGALPAADLAVGQALADVATIGILQERAIQRREIFDEQLQTALNNRVIIEQAKGVLANAGALSMTDAFDRLRRYARHNNLRLSEVARQVVDTDLGADVLAARAATAAPPRRRR